MKSGIRRVLSGVVATALAATLSISAMAADITSFDDVPADHWAYSYIMACAEHGAISGVSAPDANGVGHFAPGQYVTQAEFLAAITRLVAPEYIKPDTSGNWATPYYAAAVDSGLTNKFDFVIREMDWRLNREDMASILVSAAKMRGEPLLCFAEAGDQLGDFNEVSDYQKNDVCIAYSSGLLSGDTYGRFNPTSSMTRAEMAAVLCRLMGYTPRAEVQIPNPNLVISQYLGKPGHRLYGKILPEYATEFNLAALDNVKFGTDSRGAYVTFTAPELPEEISSDCKFRVDATVYKSNWDYFATDVESYDVKPGETIKDYFYSFASEGTKPVAAWEIDIAKVTVGIQVNSGGFTYLHTAYSNDKSHAVQFDCDTDAKESVDYDSSAIFAGIGK